MVSAGMGPAERPVVLGPAKVRRAAGVRKTVIELGHAIAVVQRGPADGGVADVAGSGRSNGRGRPGVVGPEESTVVPDEHRRIRPPVVLRMEDNRMLVGVSVMGIDGTTPPIRGQPPVHPAIVRAHEINPARPDTIRVGWIHSDDVVVPALVEKLVGAKTALRSERIDWIRQQYSVELCRIRVPHLGGPCGSTVGRAEEAVKPVIVL